ncbi:MAG: SspB family protein [Candidatus Puniceispirillaceae bacterium]
MDDTEPKAAINYELLVEDALRTVVRGSLALVEHEGLPGDSHFYITFQTTADGVQMSETLKAANPQEMTIVLQHQFWDLNVSESHFSVTLSFSGVHHNLNIPFSAVTHFNDPSVGFGLQFSTADQLDSLQQDGKAALTEVTDIAQLENEATKNQAEEKQAGEEQAGKNHSGENQSGKNPSEKSENKPILQEVEPVGDGAEIVSLDRFRKDPAPKK